MMYSNVPSLQHIEQKLLKASQPKGISSVVFQPLNTVHINIGIKERKQASLLIYAHLHG